MLQLDNLINLFEGKDSLFWFLALIGTGLFVIQFILSFVIGGDLEDGSDSSDSGKLNWITKQALTGFLMMTGWTYLACHVELSINSIASAIIALTGGMITFYLTVIIFKNAKKLHSKGTVFDIDNFIDKEATVYQNISKNTVGVITVTFNGITYYVDAATDQDAEILSFSSVLIINKVDDRTVLVVSNN